MYRLSTARFQKLRTCPSADTLIRYEQAGLSGESRERVSSHLAVCDFCGAELQLLSKHWRRECLAVGGPREMPPNLRRLAEDLMADASLNHARLLETICEIDRLTLTDAA